jgi:FAD:protein FMN transferase
MGTLLHVSASGPDSAAVEVAVDAAVAAVERVDRLMSFHAEDSELTRLNREAALTPQRVDPWTYAVLQRATRIASLSDGLFDVTVAPLLVAVGLLPRGADMPPDGGHWRDLRLLSDGRVSFERPMLVDLGGIAKGFAVDQAIHVLRRAGCTEAVVNAGGDLRRFGPKPHPIHLRRNSGLVPVAELRCGAVATSRPHAADGERLAQPIGCIFDPRQRRAWNGNGSVMVAAPSCVVADALTKVAALAGPACEPLLSRFGARALWDTEDEASASTAAS